MSTPSTSRSKATRTTTTAAPTRCRWAKTELSIPYHDREWGVPLHDDRALFEFLVLGGAQAGLSWETVLKKREAYRAAFDHFDVAKVAAYDARKVRRLLADPGIIRNRQKVASAVNNARAILTLLDGGEFASFNAYLWQFVGGRPKVNRWKTLGDLPARTAESDAVSRDMKARGFSFVGSTICYAFMQAAGMVNDHTTDCFRYAELAQDSALSETASEVERVVRVRPITGSRRRRPLAASVRGSKRR